MYRRTSHLPPQQASGRGGRGSRGPARGESHWPPHHPLALPLGSLGRAGEGSWLLPPTRRGGVFLHCEPQQRKTQLRARGLLVSYQNRAPPQKGTICSEPQFRVSAVPCNAAPLPAPPPPPRGPPEPRGQRQSLPQTYPACIYNASQPPEAGSRRFDRVIKRSHGHAPGPLRRLDHWPLAVGPELLLQPL